MGMGFVLGLRHALDADHVAAVATLLRREQGVARAMGVGALWGVGHTLSLLGAGALLLLVRARWLSRLETAGEVLVCVMLLGLGAAGLWRWRRSEGEPAQSAAPRTGRGALGIGAVHGLAGTAATALVAASAGGNGPLSMVFLLLFGVGTVCGMSAMTALMGAGLARTARRSQRAYRAMLFVASALSVAVGAAMAVSLVKG